MYTEHIENNIETYGGTDGILQTQEEQKGCISNLQAYEFFKNWSFVTWRILQNLWNVKVILEGM